MGIRGIHEADSHDEHDKGADLLARLQAGDERALGDLSDAYRRKIFQLALTDAS